MLQALSAAGGRLRGARRSDRMRGLAQQQVFLCADSCALTASVNAGLGGQSFEGLPEPDAEKSPLDAISHEFLKVIGGLRCGLEEVAENFRRFDLLDRQVRFVTQGWFCDTLSSAPIEKLALIRLDADYYESTRDALQALYPKLYSRGSIIIDDYGGNGLGARQAVDEFRRRERIATPMRGQQKHRLLGEDCHEEGHLPEPLPALRRWLCSGSLALRYLHEQNFECHVICAKPCAPPACP